MPVIGASRQPTAFVTFIHGFACAGQRHGEACLQSEQKGTPLMPKKSRTHLVTIRLRVDRPISAGQAGYAAWNAIHDMDLYGSGTPAEPWGTGKILVPPRTPKQSPRTKTGTP